MTDRFPFGKGEAFVENEIEYVAAGFDRVIILPTGLTVNVDEMRTMPDNVLVLPPANTKDLYENGRPGKLKRLVWTLKYMSGWSVKAIFSKDFKAEITTLKNQGKLNTKTIKAVIRSVAPVLRNTKHFANVLRDVGINVDDEIYVYSYWINGLLLKVPKLLPCGRVVKKVARAHRYDLYDEHRDSGYIPLKIKVIEEIDRLYLISEDGLEYVKNKHGENEHKYCLSYLGTKDYGKGPDREKGDNNPLKIVSCSFVIPVKRVEKIIGALSYVNEIQIEWTHFGGGQDLNAMKELAEITLGSKDNINYNFFGFIKNAQLMKYYKDNSVDLFINTSKHEGLPVSIMEAMSFGIPIIATDVGSTRETIDEGVSGYLLPEEFEDEALAELITGYAKMNAHKKTEFSKASRQLWEKKFSARDNYSSFMKGLQ